MQDSVEPCETYPKFDISNTWLGMYTDLGIENVFSGVTLPKILQSLNSKFLVLKWLAKEQIFICKLSRIILNQFLCILSYCFDPSHNIAITLLTSTVYHIKYHTVQSFESFMLSYVMKQDLYPEKYMIFHSTDLFVGWVYKLRCGIFRGGLLSALLFAYFKRLSGLMYAYFFLILSTKLVLFKSVRCWLISWFLPVLWIRP